MKARRLLLAVLAFLAISAMPFTPFPQAEISNGLVRARLYLPDAENGYYRATRFDWAGVIPELEYKGHSYCGQWFEKYDPATNDAAMGPVESFAPLGYDSAGTGGPFVQIGVGVLARDNDPVWQFYKYYKILNHGEWKIRKEPDRVEFIHTVNDPGYSYEYRKTLALTKDKPELLLIHSLKNTGQRTIETNVFDHNFFVLDQQPTGPDGTVSFPFPLTLTPNKGVIRGIGTLVEVKGNQLVFLKTPEKNESVYTLLEGFGNSPKDYDVKIENHKTGAALRISCDRPMEKLLFWANPAVYCPEPYIHIRIAPGEVFRWKISYEFYTCWIRK